MTQALHNPQRYRGFVLTATGLQKLRQRIQQLEAQTRLRQSPRTIAERVQLSEPDGIHPITVRKILGGDNGVDRRSIQVVFQVLQLQLEEGDYAHAGLCQRVDIQPKLPEMPPRSQDWSEALHTPNFYGRVPELSQLNQAILTEHCRLVQILGMAGVGKTVLTTQIAKAVEPEFERVIWQSLHHAPALQTVLSSILQLLSKQSERVELPTQIEALTRLLIQQLQNHRCLLILDHFDAILCDKQYAGYCRPGYEAYNELLRVIAEVPHQSCLLITSREKLRVTSAQKGSIRLLQLNGLSPSDCQQIVNSHHQLVGTASEWQSLVHQCNGHPSVAKMVTDCIHDYFDSCIANYLDYLKSGELLFGDLRDLFDQQFERLFALEQELVHRLALYRAPVSAAQFHEDLRTSVSHQPWLEALDSLGRRSLLRRQGAYLTLDPLMQTYVNECLLEPDSALSKPRLKIVAN